MGLSLTAKEVLNVPQGCRGGLFLGPREGSKTELVVDSYAMLCRTACCWRYLLTHDPSCRGCLLIPGVDIEFSRQYFSPLV